MRETDRFQFPKIQIKYIRYDTLFIASKTNFLSRVKLTNFASQSQVRLDFVSCHLNK
jgi:hypothetical protein